MLYTFRIFFLTLFDWIKFVPHTRGNTFWPLELSMVPNAINPIYVCTPLCRGSEFLTERIYLFGPHSRLPTYFIRLFLGLFSRFCLYCIPLYHWCCTRLIHVDVQMPTSGAAAEESFTGSARCELDSGGNLVGLRCRSSSGHYFDANMWATYHIPHSFFFYACNCATIN